MRFDHEEGSTNSGLEDRTCNLCGARNFKVELRIGPRLLVSCTACSLVTTHPLPSEDQVRAVYETDNYFETPYFEIDDEQHLTVHYGHFLKVADLVGRECLPHGKVLEIGPGNGAFLKLCLNRGIDIEGLDLSSRVAQDLAERLGCFVEHGTIEERSASSGGYAAVVAFDVIEHCLNPAEWLKSIHAALKPRGLLAISTINVRNALNKTARLLYRAGYRRAVKKLYPPYHIYYFTPDILKRYLEKSGFSVISTEQENYDVRKASSALFEQLALRCIYQWQNMTGNKTNLYVIARRN